MGCNLRNSSSLQSSVQEVLKRYGRIDVLARSAGVNNWKMPQDCSPDQRDTVTVINLKGAFLRCQAVCPTLNEPSKGRLINIGSMWLLHGVSKAVSVRVWLVVHPADLLAGSRMSAG